MPKKNLNKIPPNIMKKVQNIDSRYIVVGLLKTIERE